jgi:PAS domain S-box-containing protein
MPPNTNSSGESLRASPAGLNAVTSRLPTRSPIPTAPPILRTVTRSRRAAPRHIRAELPEGPLDLPALGLSSEVLQAIFDRAPVMFALWDASRRLLLVNPEWERVLGWTLEEAQRIDLAVATFPDPRDRQRAIDLYRRADQRWVTTQPRRRDGTRIETAWVHLALPGGVVLAIGHDLTERRQVEEDLRRAAEERRRAEELLRQSNEELRALAARVQAVREEEGTRIAREVHDEVGQLLTALRLDVAWLERKLPPAVPPAGEEVAERLRSMSRWLDTAAHAIQRIASELRPAVLDQLGLEAAVEWYVGEFEKRSGISCRLRSDFAGKALDVGRSIALFRILQEALTNAARHSGATEVEIRLRAEAGRVLLEVTDNGSGISDDRIAASSSLGLLGMRERARLLGGELTIRRNPAAGTTVAVILPR